MFFFFYPRLLRRHSSTTLLFVPCSTHNNMHHFSTALMHFRDWPFSWQQCYRIKYTIHHQLGMHFFLSFSHNDVECPLFFCSHPCILFCGFFSSRVTSKKNASLVKWTFEVDIRLHLSSLDRNDPLLHFKMSRNALGFCYMMKLSFHKNSKR